MDPDSQTPFRVVAPCTVPPHMFFPYPPSCYSQNFVSRYTLQRQGTLALGFSACDKEGLFRHASRLRRELDILGRWVWESAHVHVSSLRDRRVGVCVGPWSANTHFTRLTGTTGNATIPPGVGQIKLQLVRQCVRDLGHQCCQLSPLASASRLEGHRIITPCLAIENHRSDRVARFARAS